MRRRLNLFQGQLLNWEIYEDGGQTFIRLFSGGGVLPDDHAAFQDLLTKKKTKEKGAKCGTKIGKLEAKRRLRVEEENPVRGTELTALKEMVSEFSQFLLSLQARLNQ